MLNNIILLNEKKTVNIYKKWKQKLLNLQELAGDSIPIYLLIAPHNAQINNTYLKRNKILGADLSTDILNPHSPLIEQIKKDFKEWKVINPLPEFQQLKNNDSLYYQNDPHLTVVGQKELAKIILNNFHP